MQVLSGLRVLDLSQSRAGAYCTKLMAGFGAEVIKIEPSDGEELRRRGPFYRDPQGREHSIPSLWYNTGKKSITLNLLDEGGRQQLRDMVASADVVLETFRPGTMESWGLGYESLKEINSGIILTSVTNFGQSGPYREMEAEEITLYALSGGMKLTGDPDREPLNSGVHVSHNTAGLWAYIGTLLAVIQRSRSGVGQWVDVSIHECCIDSLEILFIEHLHLGKRSNRNNDRHPLVPWEAYPCKDGQVTVVGGPIRHWFRGSEMFEVPAFRSRKYFTIEDRMKHRDEVIALMQPWLSRHTRAEVFETGQRHKLAFGMLCSLEEVFDLPQHRALNFFPRISINPLGACRYASRPFDCGPSAYRTESVPSIGESNGCVGTRCVQEFLRTGSPANEDPRPLTGIRVLDFSTYWSAPHSTRILADSGAEVITVEYTGLLCVFRGGRLEDEKYNQHPRWHQINRNKKSITLDLKQDWDREVVRRLVAECDVVVENSRPGVMEELGLGYDDLCEIRPDIILLSLSGYGPGGPWADYAAVGAAIEATAGVQSMTGYPDESRRRRIKEMDICAGLVAACSILTAIVQRSATGRGQWIRCSMMEAVTHALIGESLLHTELTGHAPMVQGNRDSDFAPQGVYRCQGEDAWVALVVRTADEWLRLCDVIGKPEWKSEPALANAKGRREDHDAIDEAITAWTCGRSHSESMAILQEHDIAAGAVLSFEDLVLDPHLADREFLVSCEGDSNQLYPRAPLRMSGADLKINHRGPDLGAHNLEILHGLLGCPPEEIRPIQTSEIFSAYHPFPWDRPSDACGDDPPTT